MKQMSRKKKHNMSRRRQNRKNLFLIACIVSILCGTMGYQKCKLDAKQKQVRAEYRSLEEKQKRLEAKQKEMKDKKVYMNTKKYIEEEARDKLGLVYPGEIVFTPEP